MKRIAYLLTFLTICALGGDADAKVRAGSKRLKIPPVCVECCAGCPDPPSPTPPPPPSGCNYGGTGGHCDAPPHDPFERLPIAAQKAEALGHRCDVFDDGSGGECGKAYDWQCVDGQCRDSLGGGWGDHWYDPDLAAVVDDDPNAACQVKGDIETCCSNTTVPGLGVCCDNNGSTGVSACGWAVCVGGECFGPTPDTSFEVGGLVIAAGDGWHAVDAGDTYALCIGNECTAVDSRWGCQYFSETGPDDMLVCMLTVADEACGGCISGDIDE